MFKGCIQAEGSDTAYRKYTTLTVRRGNYRGFDEGTRAIVLPKAASTISSHTEGRLDAEIVAEIQALTGVEDTRMTARFRRAASLAARIGTFVTITMTPATHPSLKPGILQVWLKPKWSQFIVPTLLLSSVDSLGHTLSKACQVLLGCVLAVMNGFCLCHIFDDGVKSTAMWNFMIFTLTVLWIDIDMNVKIFALSWNVNFVMTFANPAVTLEPVMAFRMDSGMTCIMFVTLVGCLASILAMLLPSPITATSQAKIHAARTAKATARLFTFVTEYYTGEEKTISINIWLTEVKALREEIAGMKEHLQAAWWEGLDLGSRGIVRELLLRHLNLLQSIDKRLLGLKVCVFREEFSEAHRQAMTPVRSILLEVACSVGDLLMAATVAAADGSFNDSEREMLVARIAHVQGNVSKLAQMWHFVRKGDENDRRDALSPDLLTESFFIFEVSAYARLVSEFTKDMVERTPQGGVSPWQVLCKVVRNAFSREKLLSAQQINFTLRNFISLSIGFYYGLYCQNYDFQVPQFMCFMLSKDLGSALKTNLGRVQGTVLGVLFGHLMYSELHSCSPLSVAMRLALLFTFEFIAEFIHKYSAEYGFIGMLLAIFGGKALATQCTDHIDETERLKNIEMAYHSFKAVAIALGIILTIDMMLRREQASAMARRMLFGSVDTMISSFSAFLEGRPGESGSSCRQLQAMITDAKRLCEEANQEPRWHKTPFKHSLFKELCHTMETLNLDLETLQLAFEGADNQPDDLFERVVSHSQSNFDRVKEDILETLGDMKKLTQVVLEHETPCPLDAQVLSDLQQRRNMEKLDGLEELLQDIQLVYHENLNSIAPNTMEDDEVCRLCVVFEMLDSMISTVAKAISNTVESI